jgi:hypothetical protein
MLSLDSLNKAGAFCGAPVKKEITWTSGGETHKAEVLVRPLSYSSAVSDITSRDAIAGRIACSILGDDLKPVFTVGDITGESNPERGPLCSSLTLELLRVIGEVSCFAEKKTISKLKKKSGTN